MGERKVNLRAEHAGDDHRFLDARLSDDGDLLLEGQDLGPATAPVSSDGEHEWFTVVRQAHLPALLAALGADPGDDVLDVLEARCSGPGSYDLERLLRDQVVPSELFVW